MRTRIALLTVAIALVGFSASHAAARREQAPSTDSSGPAFEAASIKVNHSADSIMSFQHQPGGRFIARNVTVRLLMEYAFDLNRSRISGVPPWATSERYDIAATAEADAPVSEFPNLVRTLLQDRFHVVYHHQAEERDEFVLVVSKAGKLRVSEPGDCVVGADGLPCGGMRNTPGHTGGHKMTGADLGAALSFFLNAPVIDQTGLTGRYDVDLDWSPDMSDTTGPSIFTAVQEQLGLKLEPTKGPVDVVVIDHVEQPTPD
jgi:uncharacterized protein (TIGR03435 family)